MLHNLEPDTLFLYHKGFNNLPFTLLCEDLKIPIKKHSHMGRTAITVKHS